MVLAYECLRYRFRGEDETDVHLAWDALDQAKAALRVVRCDELTSAIEAAGRHWRTVPMLVARLVLYLRAVLRADRGDFGACPDDCWGCRWAYVSDDFEHAPPRHYIPLWEQAPATRKT